MFKIIFYLFFFLLSILLDFGLSPFSRRFFFSSFFFLLSVLVDFGVVPSSRRPFYQFPSFSSFQTPEDLLTFFAVFPEDFAPFPEDRAPFAADALEDFGLFAAEVLAGAVLFTGCFFEVFLASLPDRPLASFFPNAPFWMPRRDPDFFFAYFPCFDFLPFALFELFIQPGSELKEGLPFVFGSMVEGLYSSFNRRRYCSWSSRTLSFTWPSSCWATLPNAKMAERETTAGSMSIFRNLMGTPLLESHFGPIAENRPAFDRSDSVLVSVLEREANIAQPRIFTTTGKMMPGKQVKLDSGTSPCGRWPSDRYSNLRRRLKSAIRKAGNPDSASEFQYRVSQGSQVLHDFGDASSLADAFPARIAV